MQDPNILHARVTIMIALILCSREVISYGTQTPRKHPYCFMNIWWATCAPQFTVLRTSTILQFLISIGFLCSKSGLFLDMQFKDIC
jgi:hypothetical protein